VSPAHALGFSLLLAALSYGLALLFGGISALLQARVGGSFRRFEIADQKSR
jgi:ABC-type Fe3+ transport system permease subunit